MLQTNRLLVTELNSKLETALHVALKNHTSFQMCETLLKWGTDPNGRDINQETCLGLVKAQRKNKEWLDLFEKYVK